MVSISLPTAATILCLTLAGVTNGAPTGTATERSAEVEWPANAAVFKRNIQTGNTDTNAKRLARGLPLKAPVRRSLSERYTGAPAQASGTTNTEIFTYQFCATGGFSFYAMYEFTTVYATNQEQANACAEKAEQDGMTVFAVRNDNYCFTGPQSIASYMGTCDQYNYAVYMFDA